MEHFLQNQLLYSLTGSMNALRYYFIDPLSGLITLKRLLTDSTNPSDVVSGHSIHLLVTLLKSL